MPGSCSSPPSSRARPWSTGSPRASCIHGRSDVATASIPPTSRLDGRRARGRVRARWRCGSRSRARRRRAECEPVEGGVRVRLDFSRRAVRAARLGSGGGGAAAAAATRAREQCRSPASGRSRSRRRSRTTGATWRPRRARRWRRGSLRKASTRPSGRARCWAGPAAEDALPAPGADADGVEAGRMVARRAASTRTRSTSSSSGPSGRVPEEFLDFGPVAAGQGVHLRAVVEGRAAAGHASGGRRRGDEARLARRSAGGAGRRGLPCHGRRSSCLRARSSSTCAWPRRRTSTRCERTSRSSPTSRVTRARVAASRRRRSRRARSSRSPRGLSLPADPISADVLVGANGPCRVLVDGREVGRQGGFDPYAEWDRDRLQPYDLREQLPSGRSRAPARAARARPHPAGSAARRHRPHAGGDARGALGRELERIGRRRRGAARPPSRPARRPRLAATHGGDRIHFRRATGSSRGAARRTPARPSP